MNLSAAVISISDTGGPLLMLFTTGTSLKSAFFGQMKPPSVAVHHSGLWSLRPRFESEGGYHLIGHKF